MVRVVLSGDGKLAAITVGSELRCIETLDGWSREGEASGIGDEDVVFEDVFTLVETVDIEVVGSVEYRCIVRESTIPMPAAGGGYRFEAGGTAVFKFYILEVAVAVEKYTYAYAVAYFQF